MSEVIIDKNNMVLESDPTSFKPELTASEAVNYNLGEFARYSIREVLPDVIDGLKLVHRRILFTLGTDPDRKKSHAVCGQCMEKYHPHGDSGIYGALIGLAQPFNNQVPFIKAEGNVGSYSGEEPAASRYLDVIAGDFSKDVFFNNVNIKTLTYIPTEVGKGIEPAYLVPVIPTALLTGAYGIAVGYKTNIPYMNFINVCNLVLKFIEIKSKCGRECRTKFKEYAKYLIPDYPTFGYILNEQELLREYSKGNFNVPILCCGTMDITPDRINILSIPYGSDFSKKVYEVLLKMIKDTSFVSANFSEVINMAKGRMLGNAELVCKRNTDPFSVLDQLKKVVGFTKNITPIWNFSTCKGNLVNCNPIDLLCLWYDARVRSIRSDLTLTNDELIRKHRRLEALVIVVDHTDKVLKIFKSANNEEETIQPLCEQFKLTRFQASYLASLELRHITTQRKQELLLDLKKVDDEIASLKHKYANIDDIIVAQVNALLKKYKDSCPRRTKIPRYIGAVRVNNSGYIQVSDLDEMSHIVKRWINKSPEIILYKQKSTLYISDGNSYTSNSEIALQKELSGVKLSCVPNSAKYTIIIKPDGTIGRMDGIVGLNNTDNKIIYVGDRVTTLLDNGKVVSTNTNDIPKRNALDNGGVKTNILYVSDIDIDNEEIVVVTANTKQPNNIMLERVKKGGKFTKLLFGRTIILGVYRLTDNICLTMPNDLLSRCNSKHLYFEHLDKLIPSKTCLIQLSKKTTSTNLNLVLYDKKSEIWTVRSK